MSSPLPSHYYLTLAPELEPPPSLSHSYLVPNVITLATVGGVDAISALNEPPVPPLLRPSKNQPNAHCSCLSGNSRERYITGRVQK